MVGVSTGLFGRGPFWRPRLRLGGLASTDWAYPRPTSRRPAPWVNVSSAGLGWADPISAALICAGVQVGWASSTIAAPPVTCGVAIDVPESWTYCCPGLQNVPVELHAPVMPTPGAVMSGLSASSPSRGPLLEKEAMLSLLSTAPTVSAESASPGDPSVW